MIPRIGQRWIFNSGVDPLFIVEITGFVNYQSAGGIVVETLNDKYCRYAIGRKENDWTIHHNSKYWKLLPNQDKE